MKLVEFRQGNVLVRKLDEVEDQRIVRCLFSFAPVFRPDELVAGDRAFHFRGIGPGIEAAIFAFGEKGFTKPIFCDARLDDREQPVRAFGGQLLLNTRRDHSETFRIKLFHHYQPIEKRLFYFMVSAGCV